MAPSLVCPSPHWIVARSIRSPGVESPVWISSATGLPGLPVISETGSTVIKMEGAAVCGSGEFVIAGSSLDDVGGSVAVGAAGDGAVEDTQLRPGQNHT